ncbi:MAG: ribonuclease P protein component [Opitutales bacterium]
MRLPRERRIRASDEFCRLRKEGSRVDCGAFLLNCRKSAAGAPARFAVIAAKKSLPLAVDRNRAKRLSRELFRTDPAAFPAGWEVVLVVRSGMLRRPLADLRRVYAAAAARITASGPSA